MKNNTFTMQECQLNYVQRSILQWQLYKVQFNKGLLYNGNSTKVNLQRLTLQRSTLQVSGLDGGRRVPGTFFYKSVAIYNAELSRVLQWNKSRMLDTHFKGDRFVFV